MNNINEGDLDFKLKKENRMECVFWVESEQFRYHDSTVSMLR